MKIDKFKVYIPKTKTTHYETGNQPIKEINFVRKTVSIIKEKDETKDKHVIETYDFKDVEITHYIEEIKEEEYDSEMRIIYF